MKYRLSLKNVLRGASLSITALALTLLFSCEEEASLLGRNLLPSSDDMFTQYFEGEMMLSASSLGKPILTSVNTRLLAGSYNDSIFGFSKSSFFIRPEVQTRSVGEDMDIDSVFIYLEVDGYYGDTTSVHTLRIYEVTDSISTDSSFYSDENMEGRYDPDELAHKTISPLDTLVKIEINDLTFIEKLETAPDSIYEDVGDFMTYFHGLYFTTDPLTEQGSIIYYNLSSINTRMYVYYRDDTTNLVKTLSMTLGNLTPKINIFEHDYTNARAVQYLDDPDAHDSLIFVSSMAGINTRLYFPEVGNWLDSVPVAINKAELIIPADTTYGISESDFPVKLFMFTVNEDNEYDFMYDNRIDSDGTYFNGFYDTEESAYIFNMGAHLQSFIGDGSTNMNLILIAGDNSLTANRAVLKSPFAGSNKMTLKITYTKF